MLEGAAVWTASGSARISWSLGVGWSAWRRFCVLVSIAFGRQLSYNHRFNVLLLWDIDKDFRFGWWSVSLNTEKMKRRRSTYTGRYFNDVILFWGRFHRHWRDFRLGGRHVSECVHLKTEDYSLKTRKISIKLNKNINKKSTKTMANSNKRLGLVSLMGRSRVEIVQTKREGEREIMPKMNFLDK